MVHLNTQHPRSRHMEIVVHPVGTLGACRTRFDPAPRGLPDQTSLPVDLVREKGKIEGNADGNPAKAFDLVMAAPGFHVDQGTGRQALAIHRFNRCHIKSFLS